MKNIRFPKRNMAFLTVFVDLPKCETFRLCVLHKGKTDSEKMAAVFYTFYQIDGRKTHIMSTV